MKSQIWLLDPRPDLSTLVRMVEEGLNRRSLEFAGDARRASAPVTCTGNSSPRTTKPDFTLRQALENPSATSTASCPAASFMQERRAREALASRGRIHQEPQAQQFFGPKDGAVGVIVLGGLFNGVLRPQQLGLADVWRDLDPDLCPQCRLSDHRRRDGQFCCGKSAVLMAEEERPIISSRR